jgi:hypothetical protein
MLDIDINLPPEPAYTALSRACDGYPTWLIEIAPDRVLRGLWCDIDTLLFLTEDDDHD